MDRAESHLWNDAKNVVSRLYIKTLGDTLKIVQGTKNLKVDPWNKFFY